MMRQLTDRGEPVASMQQIGGLESKDQGRSVTERAAGRPAAFLSKARLLV